MAFYFLLESSFLDSHGYVRYNIQKSALTLKADGELAVQTRRLTSI